MSSDHLGDAVTALVDGALPHAERERVLAHLAHCEPCRDQVDAHRRLKAVLGDLRAAPPPAPSDALVARLLAVSSAPLPPAAPPSTPRRGRRPRAARPPLRPGLRRVRRTTGAGVLVAVGLVGALALGAPSSGPAAPVDPTSPALLVDHISTTSEVPLTEPAVATLVPAGAPLGTGPGR